MASKQTDPRQVEHLKASLEIEKEQLEQCQRQKKEERGPTLRYKDLGNKLHRQQRAKNRLESDTVAVDDKIRQLQKEKADLIRRADELEISIAQTREELHSLEEKPPQQEPQRAPSEIWEMLRQALNQVAANPALPPARVEQCTSLKALFASIETAMPSFQELWEGGTAEAEAVCQAQAAELERLEQARAADEQRAKERAEAATGAAAGEDTAKDTGGEWKEVKHGGKKPPPPGPPGAQSAATTAKDNKQATTAPQGQQAAAASTGNGTTAGAGTGNAAGTGAGAKPASAKTEVASRSYAQIRAEHMQQQAAAEAKSKPN